MTHSMTFNDLVALLEEHDALQALGCDALEVASELDDPHAAAVLDRAARRRGGPRLELSEVLHALDAEGQGSPVFAAVARWADVAGGPTSGGAQPAWWSPHDLSLEDFPPDRPKDLVAWAKARGIEACLDQPASNLDPWWHARWLSKTLSDGTVRNALLGHSTPHYVREHVISGVQAYLDWAHTQRTMEKKRATLWATPPREPAMVALVTCLRALLDKIGPLAEDCPPALPGTGPVEIRPRAVTVEHVFGGLESATAVLLLAGFEHGELRIGCTCHAGSPARSCQHEKALVEWTLDAAYDAAHPLHPALVELTSVPSWTHFVRALTDCARDAASPEPRAQRKRRLVWRLSDESPARRGTPLVQPFVQKLDAHGRWSRGSYIDPYRLEREAPKLGLDEADERVLDAMFGGRRATSANLIEALVSHPRVFAMSAPNARLRVEKVPITLAWRPVDGGGRLGVRVGPVELEPHQLLQRQHAAGHFILCDVAAGRCLVASLGARALAIVEAAARFPAVVPPEAQGAAIEALVAVAGSKDAKDVALDLPREVAGEERPPSTRIVLRLEPFADGLRVATHVRPCPGGQICVPGSGSGSVFGHDGSARIFVRRDLASERSAALAVEQALGLGEESRDPNEPFVCVANDLERALAIVEATRALGDEVDVEWADDTSPWRIDDASARALRVRVGRTRDWLQVEGEVEVDGAKIALADLLAAVRARKRFVRIGPARFARIEDALRERLAGAGDVLFTTKSGPERHVVAALAAAPALAELDPQSNGRADALRTILERARAANELRPAVPRGLQAKLRDYQRDGFEWLARLAAWGAGACLADDMGLGKTVQALAMLLARAGDGPALVVAPTSVGSGWASEAARFAPGLRVRLYRGPERDAMLEGLGARDVLVTSYDIVARDAAKLGAIRFTTLVLDEAQAIKNARTRRARAVRAIDAEWRVALTGTPLENHLGELWSLFDAVSPGLLGTWEDFRDRFAAPIERDHDLERLEALRQRLRPFLLRRTKDEVARELPPRTEVVRAVDLSHEERALYERARLAALDTLLRAGKLGEDQRFNVLAAITRLRQLACHPRLVDAESRVGSAKLAALLELIGDELGGDHRALVFSQFTKHLALVREALDARAVPYLYLDGSTPAAERGRLVERFQAGEGKLFLISLKAGGTGLNLMGADWVVHLDPWWNPAVEDQATDRAHRIGQTRPVTVVRLVASATIEEAVLELHAEKRALVTGVLDGAEAAGKLSVRDLVDLVKGAGLDQDLGSDDDGAAPPSERPPPSASKPRRGGSPRSSYPSPR